MIKIISKSVLSILVLSAFAYAESKSELMNMDATVEKSSRKAIVALSHLGLETKKLSFPVYYTPAGKNAQKRYVGEWHVSISQDYADKMLAEQYDMLVSNRFDKVIFTQDKAEIITPTKNISAALGVNRIAFDTGDYTAFATTFNSYMNEKVAAKTAQVLSMASEARYASMDASTASTFIHAKAKESGIPAEVLVRLMNASYAFGVYLPAMKGEVSISQILHETKNGSYYTYSTSFASPLNTRLLIYKFNGKEYTFYKEVDSKAGFDLMGSWAKMISGSASISTSYLPNAQHGQALFDQVFANSLKETLLAISTRLKDDRAFSISAAIENVDWGRVTVPIGYQEDIRVDHPMRLFRTINDKEEEVGLFKVRTAGKNCALMPLEDQTSTIGDMIMGSAEIADLAVEKGWTGVYGAIGYTSTVGSYDFSQASSEVVTKALTKSGDSGMVTLSFNGDLGYILNSSALSEIWMNMGFGIGSVTNASDLPTVNVTSINTITPKTSDGLAAKAMLGFEKRFYPIALFQVGLGIDLGIDAAMYSYSTNSSTYTSGSLTMGTIHVVPRVKVNFTPTLNFEVVATAGWNVPLGTSTAASLSDNDSDTDNDPLTTISGVSRSQGLDVHFGIAYHLDFAGPFAKMFARPSKLCNALKNRN